MPFDYRKGRLFRFPYRLKNVEAGTSHGIVHFWLCAKCSKVYTLEYRERSGTAVLRSRSSPAKPNRQKFREDVGQAVAAGTK